MKSINLYGVNTTYAEAGDGDTVILLHCSGGSSHQWNKVTSILKDRFRVIAPNLRGYGGSEKWDIRRSPSLLEEAEGVVQLARMFPGNVHLVGHAYGGAVALLAATKYPDVFTSLAVLEPTSFNLLREGSFGDREMYTEIARLAMTLANSAVMGQRDVGLEKFVDYWSGKGTWNSISEAARQPLCERVEAIVFNFCATLGDDTFLSSLSRHNTPTLLMSGERTLPVVKRIASMLACETPGSRYVEIEGASHMSPRTHPKTLATLILDHAGRSSALDRLAA